MAKSKMEERIESTYNFGVDFKTRTVYIIGEIEAEVSKKAIIGIHMLDSTKGPITIVLNTIGGDSFEGFAIYDAIKSCKNHTTTVGMGAVMSMGAAIFQAGDLRQMSPNARFMIHNGSVSYDGEADKAKNFLSDLDTDNEVYRKILAERSGLPMLKVKSMCDKETYMTAQEAVEKGFADEILG